MSKDNLNGRNLSNVRILRSPQLNAVSCCLRRCVVVLRIYRQTDRQTDGRTDRETDKPRTIAYFVSQIR